MIELAPAKLNLCLALGPARADGRHELVTVLDSLSLCDELTIDPGLDDEVVCDGVAGPNLVAAALAALRAAGWDGPRLRVAIEKRIPVAAGLGGGSADAAALLRAATRLHPLPDGVSLPALAAALGADVPSQLAPGLCLGTGAGDVIEPLAPVAPYGAVLVPASLALSTADVYREADRLGLGRTAAALERCAAQLRARPLAPDDVANDLQPAALSLAPAVEATLDGLLDAGADQAIVCGSGPTVAGLCWGIDAADRAARVAARVGAAAVAVSPVTGGARHAVPNQ